MKYFFPEHSRWLLQHKPCVQEVINGLTGVRTAYWKHHVLHEGTCLSFRNKRFVYDQIKFKRLLMDQPILWGLVENSHIVWGKLFAVLVYKFCLPDQNGVDIR